MVVSPAAGERSCTCWWGGLSFLRKLSRLVQVPMIAEFCGRAILAFGCTIPVADRFSRVRRGEGRINKSHDTVRDLARRGDVFGGVGDSIMHASAC